VGPARVARGKPHGQSSRGTGLKITRPQGREGSAPSSGTITYEPRGTLVETPAQPGKDTLSHSVFLLEHSFLPTWLRRPPPTRTRLQRGRRLTPSSRGSSARRVERPANRPGPQPSAAQERDKWSEQALIGELAPEVTIASFTTLSRPAAIGFELCRKRCLLCGVALRPRGQCQLGGFGAIGGAADMDGHRFALAARYGAQFIV
jgi:hypothetical protein